MFKLKKFIFLFSLLFIHREALTSWEINGKVFSDLYLPTRKTADDFQQISTSTWLQAQNKLNENTFIYVEVTGDYFQKTVSTTKNPNSFHPNLREAYGVYSNNKGFEFRMGKQIIPWGVADGINPTDYLTSRDYTFFNPESELRRQGPTLLWAQLALAAGTSPFQIEAAIIPVALPSTLLVPPHSVPPSGVTVSDVSQRSRHGLSSVETALKLQYTTNQWDWNIILFRGFNHQPEFIQTSALNVTPQIHRQTSVGTNFSVSFEKWVLRYESAYFWTENKTPKTNPLIQTDHWDSIVGFEIPFCEDFRFLFQYYSRFFPNRTVPNAAQGSTLAEQLINQSLSRSNQLLLNSQEHFLSLPHFKLNYTHPSRSWEADVFFGIQFPGHDFLLKPKFSYAWTDHFRTTVGLDHAAGPADRPLGAQHAYNSVYLEGKYTF